MEDFLWWLIPDSYVLAIHIMLVSIVVAVLLNVAQVIHEDWRSLEWKREVIRLARKEKKHPQRAWIEYSTKLYIK